MAAEAGASMLRAEHAAAGNGEPGEHLRAGRAIAGRAGAGLASFAFLHDTKNGVACTLYRESCSAPGDRRFAARYRPGVPCYTAAVIRTRYALLLLLLSTALGCREAPLYENPDAASAETPTRWPVPDDDLVPAVGSPRTLDIATWNIEWFPRRSSTIAVVADLISSLELDLVAVQEIASADAFGELVERLPEHEGILSEHIYGDGTYQKIGVIYRVGAIQPMTPELLFFGQTYPFPRPPLAVRLRVVPEARDGARDGAQDATHDGAQLGECPASELMVIAVHLKAGVSADDAARRQRAVSELEPYMRALTDAGDSTRVVLLGDFNEVIDTARGHRVLAPLLDDAERYRFHTAELVGNSTSFLPSHRLIDHIVSSVSEHAPAASPALIPRLDLLVERYEAAISDHLPVVVSIPYDCAGAP